MRRKFMSTSQFDLARSEGRRIARSVFNYLQETVIGRTIAPV
jgi:hypothetical protein